MIAHLATVWAFLLVAFLVGCIAGTMAFRGLARTRAANLQNRLAEVVGRSGDAFRDRFGMVPKWRPRRGAAPRPVPIRPAEPVIRQPQDRAPVAEPVWDVVDRAVSVAPTQTFPEAPLPDFFRMELAEEEIGDDAPIAEMAEGSALDDGAADRAELDEAHGQEQDEPEDSEERDEADVGLPPATYPVVEDSRSAPAVRRAAEPRVVDFEEQPVRRSSLPSVYQRPLLVARADGETEIIDGLELRRPAMLAAPRNGVPDNLQRIRGIGERNEVRLNGLGIFHFSQIAAWTPAEIRWIGRQLSFPDRIESDDWVGQAIVLGSGGETGFTKSAERRRARRRYGREIEEAINEEPVDDDV